MRAHTHKTNTCCSVVIYVRSSYEQKKKIAAITSNGSYPESILQHPFLLQKKLHTMPLNSSTAWGILFYEVQ
jgi:hypothetical protein